MRHRHGLSELRLASRPLLLGLPAVMLALTVYLLPDISRAVSPSGAWPPGAARAALSSTSLGFEPNVGQAGGEAQFVAHGPAYAIALSERGAALSLGTDVIRLQVEGSHGTRTPAAEEALAARVNYYIGSDPAQWRTNVHTFRKVRYSEIYPGVDLVYYGSQGRLEYDFEVAARASANKINLAFDGAEQLEVDSRGDLKIRTHGHEIAFQRPVAYQLSGAGQRTRVAARYRLSGNAVRFQVGAYDHSKKLIIDPVLAYFSYLGGSNTDVIGALGTTGGPPTNSTSSQAAAVDSAGDLYVTGYTQSTNFPTHAAFAPPATKTNGGTWAFVTKFAADAKSLIFSTYIGGTSGSDYGYGIALDAAANAFVVGLSGSNDFPSTSGAYQRICSPNYGSGSALPGCVAAPGAFISKFSPSGALLDSTFLSGTVGSVAYAVAVDGTGRPYVAGWTYPGVNVPAGSPQTQEDGFPTTAGALVRAYDYCSGCNLNGTLQFDAFVSVFNPTLSTLVYSTLFGDSQATDVGTAVGNTHGTAVSVDAAGNFYVAGYTQDAYLPVTPGALQTTATSCGVLFPNTNVLNDNCGFVAKFAPAGGANPPTLVYGTYLGHMPACCSSDYVSGIAADASGDAYVTGFTDVATFPTTADAYQTTCDEYTPTSGSLNCSAAFIAKLNPMGTSLLASSYFGGYHAGQNNISDSVASLGPVLLDAAGNVYIAGVASSGLPQVNPLGTSNGVGSTQSPFVAKLDPTLKALLFSTLFGTGGSGQMSVSGLALDSSGNVYVAGSSNAGATSPATAGAFQAAYGGGSSDGYVAKIVVQSATTTTLAAAPTSAATGTAIAFTATVAEVSGTSVPTGTVTFKDGATNLGSMTLNGTGVAVFTSSTLAVGAHSVTAAYGGDAANKASTSTAASVTVTAALPTVTFTVAPTSVTLGQSATLTWSSANATACTAGGAWSGTEPVSGTKSVTPTAAGSSSYTLSCTGAGGSANGTATLTVKAPIPTVTISVAPTSITQGQSATITWASTNATSCTASGAWSGSESASGTMSETPASSGTQSYALACTGTGGTANGTATLTVTAPAGTTPPASGSHGGGALDTWTLLGLGLILLASRGVRRRISYPWRAAS